MLFRPTRAVASRERIDRKGMAIPIQNEKALFLQCHIVVIAVKLIYGPGIGNDVMNGSGLMESLLNSIKPLHVAVGRFEGMLCTALLSHSSVKL